jgi:L-fuculose-phosphate aldolase
MNEAEARAALVAAGRRLGSRGLIAAGEGNLSIRLDETRLVITPAGHRKDELTADDLVIVDLRAADDAAAAGRRSNDGGASSDLRIHRAVLARRPDVEAVAHAHLPAAMALTLAGEVPDPAALPETALLLPRLPFVALGVPGSADLAARIAASLGGDGDEAAAGDGRELPRAVVLERHGAVAVGATIDQAVNRLELVEVLCRTIRDGLLVQAARATVAPGRDRTPRSWTASAGAAPRDTAEGSEPPGHTQPPG